MKRENRGGSASFFFFPSRPTIPRLQSLCSTISTQLVCSLSTSARKGTMVRLIASSCSADAGPSLLHPGREKRGRDDEEWEAGRRRELSSPLSLCLLPPCTHGARAKKMKKRAATLAFARPVLALSDRPFGLSYRPMASM